VPESFNFERESGEVVRRKPACRGEIGAGGHFAQHPTDIFFRIDAHEPAISHHTVQHSEDPAGLWMSNKHKILESEFSRIEAFLDFIAVDIDMAVTELGVTGQLQPYIVGEVDDFFKFSEAHCRVAIPQNPELSLETLKPVSYGLKCGTRPLQKKIRFQTRFCGFQTRRVHPSCRVVTFGNGRTEKLA
jgi:hypothetical protein